MKSEETESQETKTSQPSTETTQQPEQIEAEQPIEFKNTLLDLS